MMRPILPALSASLAAALAMAAPAGQSHSPAVSGTGASDAYAGPLFTVHEHSAGHGLGPPATWEFFLSMMDQHNIRRMVVFTGGRPSFVESVLTPHVPGRFAPFWGSGAEGFAQAPDTVRQLFSSGSFWAGTGEWGLYCNPTFCPSPRAPNSTPPDDPVLLQLYQLVAQFDRTIFLHPDAGHREALQRVMRDNPGTVFYAHGGGLARRTPCRGSELACLDVGILTQLLQTFPNFFWDVSGVTNPHMNETTVGGVDVRIHYRQDLDQHVEAAYAVWRQAFEAFPDRFMMGWDSGGAQPDYNYDPEFFALGVEFYRKLLGRFPSATAEKIAYRNAERVILRIPTLEAPADGAELETLAVTLSWINPPNTAQYQLQVRSLDTDAPMMLVTRPAEERFTIPRESPEQGASFSWRVRTTRAEDAAADESAHWRPWSEWRSFQIRLAGVASGSSIAARLP